MSFFKSLFNRPNKSQTEIPTEESYFDKNKQKIYPWIKVMLPDDESLTDNVLQLTAEDSPIMKLWIDDLFISYVFDVGYGFRVIAQRDLPNSVTVEQLHSIAVENLNRDIEFKLLDTESSGYMLTAGGNHEAGSVCLPGTWDWLADHFGDSLYVAVPAKDLVLLVPKSDTAKLENLKVFVNDIFQKGDRLLTRNIFEYDGETKKWKIFDRASGNASR